MKDLQRQHLPKSPGLVRGFKCLREYFDASLGQLLAVLITCSSVSALQGPAITMGLLPQHPV